MLCSRRKTSIRTPPNRRIEASSLQSKNISATQTTTSNLTTSSTRSSLPSQQKIKKQTKLDIISTSSKSDSNVPLDEYSIIQNQVLFSLI
ncbi:unnamed protein product, partial [Rotaria sp. Silwood2]